MLLLLCERKLQHPGASPRLLCWSPSSSFLWQHREVHQARFSFLLTQRGMKWADPKLLWTPWMSESALRHSEFWTRQPLWPGNASCCASRVGDLLWATDLPRAPARLVRGRTDHFCAPSCYFIPQTSPQTGGRCFLCLSLAHVTGAGLTWALSVHKSDNFPVY